MGWIDRLLGRRIPGELVPYDTYDAAQRVLADPYEPFLGSGSIAVADPGIPLAWHYQGGVEQLWKSQPNLRKVVDFIARNVATVPLHTFERVSDLERERATDTALDALMSAPRKGVSPFRFWHSVLSDSLLYDYWALWMLPAPDMPAGYELLPLPSWRLRFITDSFRQVVEVHFWVGDLHLPEANEGWVQMNLDELIYDHGYAPSTAGLSPVETLKDILEESAEAVAYRRQTWEQGARVPNFLTRPADAPEWSKEARERFKRSWERYVGRGPAAGGTPLLEDGMRLEAATDAFSPRDTLDLEGRQLTAVEVAAAFHIAPELVGAREGNYSNVREYRQMLYRDSLGAYIASIEQTLNAQLTPRLAGDRQLYIEANIESKLRGSFEEQAQVLSSAIGAPWMSRSEGRARMNLPYMPDGDELVVPLNVLVGGQASPRDSGSQNRTASGRPAGKASGPTQAKAAVPDTYIEKARRTLEGFYSRQGRSVLSRLGAGDDEWWDTERWNSELSDDIYQLAVMISTYVGEEVTQDIGFAPSEYNADRTLAFLRAVADRIAEDTNTTTRAQIEQAMEGELDPDERLAGAQHVFDVAAEGRSDIAATTIGTTFAGFAAVEAGRQMTGDRATKTWVVTSANPRASHAAMNGETVPVNENFSNGLPWPGSIEGGPEETAGCQCELVINTQ